MKTTPLKPILLAALATLMIAPAVAQTPAPAMTTLAALRNHARVLLVFSPGISDARTVAQVEVTEESGDDLEQRDVVVAYISTAPGSAAANDTGAPVPAALTPDTAAAARKRFHIAAGDFAVVLLGKDGSEKLRSKTPVTLEQVTTLIDSMPMRQQEMRDRAQARTATR